MREKVIKIGAKVVSNWGYVMRQVGDGGGAPYGKAASFAISGENPALAANRSGCSRIWLRRNLQVVEHQVKWAAIRGISD